MFTENILTKTETKLFEYIENGTITTVSGFKATGLHCGLKRKRKDLALIYSENAATAAGVFTQSKVRAAPVLVSEYLIKQKSKIKAILINSANANACTGNQGFNDAIDMQDSCAEELGINSSEILISSTGVIGERLKVDKIKSGLKNISEKLSSEGGFDASEAIMTTDLVSKNFAMKVTLSFGEVKIGAISKGSGMIMPNMATMLGFLTTDASIEHDALQTMLTESVNKSFNRISVDGETSTNDMVCMLANENAPIKIDLGSKDAEIFQKALDDICVRMAKSIVADGEGANKLIIVNIKNAKSIKDADLIGKAISNSPLVKTAAHGADANWGRIIGAIGYSGAEIDPDNIEIKIGDLTVMGKEFQSNFDETTAKEILLKDEIEINIDLNYGNCNSTWWTCDFSKEYVEINASYRT